MKFKALFSTAITIIFLTGFFSCKNPQSALKDGMWRGALTTETGVVIPFNFELKSNGSKKSITIINADERFDVDEITLKDDSVIIQMPIFDSEFRTVVTSENSLEGVWIKHLANKDAVMQFTAIPDTKWRIKDNAKADVNISGRFATTFTSTDNKDTTIAVGEFKQNGNNLKGTFLTTTGDYRYLEGVVDGKQLSLSCFDGSHAFLFTANVQPDKSLKNGKFYSGFSGIENFTAIKDDNARLPDAYSLTFLKPGFKKIDFSFPDLDGNKISLDDDRFKGKVTIVQLLGSWCPNCMDETAFLAPFYKKYNTKGVEIIGLAYERTTDFNKSKSNVERLKKRFDVDYPLLITGFTNDKEEVSKSLPMMSKFLAFPTAVIIDKKGNVRKIHTGFSGPGTGKYYDEFVNEFEKLINDLIAE